MSRVGIDLRIVHHARTGFHRYARGLVRSLVRFPPPGLECVLLRHPDDVSWATTAPGIEELALETPLFAPDEAARLAREIAPLGLDVLHFPFSLFPGRVARRIVLTVHDLSCVVVPGSVEERYRPHYLGALRRAATADEVVAVSDHVAAELVAAGVPAARVRRCHPLTPFEDAAPMTPFENAMPMTPFEDAVPTTAAAAPLAARLAGRRFLLSVGSLEPRKNHLALLAAFDRLRQRTAERVLLVLVGHHGWLDAPLLDSIERSPFRRDVVVVRDADDAALAWLLRGAALYVGCSLYEGFGLPVLEALAEGACVVSTPVPSLLEAGFPADGILDDTAPDALAARLATLLGSAEARDSLAERGRAAVAAFYRASDPARLARLYGGVDR